MKLSKTLRIGYSHAKIITMGLLLISLQACAPAYTPSSNAVAQAYETSGLVPSQPYTRTIFSSSNF